MTTAQSTDAPSDEAMQLLMKQLKKDEQRLIKMRHTQCVEGSIGGPRPFDFPLPGAPLNGAAGATSSKRLAIPTPPQRRGLDSGMQNVMPCRVPAPWMSEKVPGSRVPEHMPCGGERRLPLLNVMPTESTGVPPPPPLRAATPRSASSPRAATPRAQTDVSNEVFTATPRPDSSHSLRSGSRCSSRSGGISEAEDARIERLEKMLMEERVGRLEMLEKVNALSKLLTEQNKKLADGKSRNRR